MTFTICATERDPSVYRITNKGGVSLLIRKSLKQCTNAVPIESDRITGIEPTLNDSATIYIFCAYLPASNLSNDLFHECLDLLEELYITYSSKGTVIIIGDLNVKIAGPKFVFARDKRSDMFHTFVTKYNLVSVNVQSFCKGPAHTYVSFTRGPLSAIGHILVPDDLIPYVQNTLVEDDSELLLSDHMPVIWSSSLNNLNEEHFRPQERPSWEKARRLNLLNDYTFPVSHMLWPIKISSLDATTNDTLQLYNKILEILTQAAKENIPNTKYNRHAKPYWSESVKKCHADMSYRRGMWINEGRPREMQFVTFRLYKKAKEKSRRTLQNAYSIYETELYNSLDAACCVDQKTLWSDLRNKKRSSYIR